METHSNILAWRIPRTEEPGRLQSIGPHRVGHNWSGWASTSVTESTQLSSTASGTYLELRAWTVPSSNLGPHSKLLWTTDTANWLFRTLNCSHLILLHVAVQFSYHLLLKRLALPHCIFLPPVLFHWSIFLFLWSTDFYATGINKLISRWQKSVDCNGSYFDS